MSNLIQHQIDGVYFEPVNKDDFTLSFESIPTERWIRDFDTSGEIILPEEGYKVLLNHLSNVGVQQGIPYNIKIDGKNNKFFVDLSKNISISQTDAQVSIQRFKSKDDIISNLENLTWEFLFQTGAITSGSMIDVPFIVIKENQAEILITAALTAYAIGNFIADSIASTAKLIGELIAAVTPSVVVPAGATINIGTVIKFALLLVIELAKLVLLTMALIALTKQVFDLILPPLQNLKAMTFDTLLRIGLASQGLTYKSSLIEEFRKCTVVPVPIDEQKKKWFEYLNNDDRILNRGYPTSSDTTPTVMMFIDEVCKMFNVQPYVQGTIVNLEPKGWQYSQPITELAHNFNDQNGLENEYTIDTSGVWNTKILSYLNDPSDKQLFDNPKGLRAEYKSKPNNLAPLDQLTNIKGFIDLRFPFALGTIKGETKLEKSIKKLAKTIDKVLSTNFVSKLSKRDGVLAVSQLQFSVTKMIYQTGGKQKKDYVQQIGAEALYNKYHKIDDPKYQIFENYADMPLAMNNDNFNGILGNNIVSLEGENAEVLKAEYNPESNTGVVSYRKQNLEFGKNIITYLVYAE